MQKKSISVSALALQPFNIYGTEGALLVSGPGLAKCNPMTISSGMFGIMWGKPVAMVMVRPTRYTWGFIDRAPDFTINWLGTKYAEALRVCGQSSGRDGDKFAKAGIRAAAAQVVQSPVVEESVLSIECRTVYRERLKAEQCLSPEILECYPNKDFHGLFFGEVVAAMGTEEFSVKGCVALKAGRLMDDTE